MRTAFWAIGLAATALLVSGCQRNPLLVTRSACPAVAIPTYLGTVTRFNPATSTDQGAMQFTAQIVDLKGVCSETPERLSTGVSYTVAAQRRNADGPLHVELPLFVALAQGGNVLVSKQQVVVALDFAAGQLRAEARGTGQAEVLRSAATLSPEVQEKISRKRRPDEMAALSDPMSDPQVRAAVRAASFEVLVGFQLDDRSLAYNIGK